MREREMCKSQHFDDELDLWVRCGKAKNHSGLHKMVIELEWSLDG